MTCGDIQNQLPAYEEGLLSPEENEAVASHLVSCRSCRKALEDLKKAHLLVRGLKEVEPPPGFKQAVMKRIRQETKQKQRFWRKFFFPLYIKIPVQAFVVIVISVLAFYVYRQDAPQLREQGMPLPATPAWESAPHKEPAPLQRQKGNSSPVTGMGDDVAIQLQKKDEALPESVPPVPFSSSAEIVPAQSDMDKTVRENENGTPTFLGEGAATSTGVEQKGFATATKRKDAAEVLSRALPSEKNQVCESDVCRTDNGVEKEANPVPLQSAAMPEQRVSLALVLRVKDIDTALSGLRGQTQKFDTTQIKVFAEEGKTIFSTRIPVSKLEAFLTQLHELGELQAYILPTLSADTYWIRLDVSIVPFDRSKP